MPAYNSLVHHNKEGKLFAGRKAAGGHSSHIVGLCGFAALKSNAGRRDDELRPGELLEELQFAEFGEALIVCTRPKNCLKG